MRSETDGCFGKKVYASYWAAARAAKRLNRAYAGARANPYHCVFCKGYHCGNQIKGARRSGKRSEITDRD